jgi:hypothetical protein
LVDLTCGGLGTRQTEWIVGLESGWSHRINAAGSANNSVRGTCSFLATENSHCKAGGAQSFDAIGNGEVEDRKASEVRQSQLNRGSITLVHLVRGQSSLDPYTRTVPGSYQHRDYYCNTQRGADGQQFHLPERQP